MKKALLPLVIGLALTGCGSDSSSSESPTQPSPNKITAIFMDAQAVGGISYDCDDGQKGMTSLIGEFSITEGATCNFNIGGYELGRSREAITAQNNQITSLGLKPTAVTQTLSEPANSDHSAKISALMQSIDVNQQDAFIDTRNVVVSSLIQADPLKAQDFEQAMSSVKILLDGTEQSIPAENLKTPEEAQKEVTKQYESDNVKQVVNELKYLLAGDITTVHMESTLMALRQLLDSDDGSNGYHQKALDAILEIAEIANVPEVSNRVDITGTNYSEMLAKALEATINPYAIVELVNTPIGTTDDASNTLVELAQRLENASVRLATAMPGEGYKLPYSDTHALTYQDSLVIRVASLLAANSLYTAAAYNAGDDTNYLPQSDQFNDVAVIEEISVSSWSEGNYEQRTELDKEWHERQIEMSVEYDNLSADPVTHIQSPELFTYRSEADVLLKSAKSALYNAATVAENITYEDYLDDDKAELAKEKMEELQMHLLDPDSSIKVDTEEGEVFANLHAFYNVEKGIDRSDIEFSFDSVPYSCDMENLPGGTNAEYSLELSKIFGEPTCSHNGDYIDSQWEGGYTNWRVIKTISYQEELSYDEEQKASVIKHTHTFIPALDANYNILVSETSDSTILEVVWCGINENSNEKISCFDGE